jgi:rubrerythrin
MIFLCPVCGRVKKYLQWKILTDKERQEMRDYREALNIVPVKCPICKVNNAKANVGEA